MSASMCAVSTLNAVLPRAFHSRDACQIVDLLSKQLSPHEMKVRAGTVKTDIRMMDMGPLKIGYIDYGASVEISPEPLGNYLLVHSGLSGASTVTNADGTRMLRGDRVIVSKPGERVVYGMTRECRHLTIKVDLDALRNDFSLCSGEDGIARMLASLESESVIPRWADTVLHLAEMFPLTNQMTRRDAIVKGWAVQLVDMLLCATPAHARVSTLGMPWYVRRACEIIAADCAGMPSICELSAAVGVSARTLQTGFIRSCGVTPAEYVRERKLEHMHATLQRVDSDSKVTEIMAACGITSMGRFAQYYQQRYHCSPSETLRKARAGAHAKKQPDEGLLHDLAHSEIRVGR